MTHTTEQLEQMLADATPGPWQVGNRHTKSGVYTANGDLIASTHGSMNSSRDRGEEIAEQDACATIIAAAPDLAAELIAARRKLEAAERVIRSAQQISAGFEAGYYRNTPASGALYAALTAWEAAQ